MQAYLNSIVGSPEHSEVELRFYLDDRIPLPDAVHTNSASHTVDEMRRLVETLAAQAKMATVSQSINFIHNNNIRQLRFINGVRDKSFPDTYTKKTQHMQPAYMVSENFIAKLAVSIETPVDKFEMLAYDIIRVKHRLSLVISPHEDFRIDITLTYTLDNNSSQENIRNIRDKMFVHPHPLPSVLANFLSHPAWSTAQHIEVEAEYIGDKSKLTIASFRVINILRDIAYDITGGEAPDEYQRVKLIIATLMYPRHAHQFRGIRGYGLKRLGNQVIELTRSVLERIRDRISQYYITPKLDGTRTIILIDDRVYALNDKLTVLDVSEAALTGLPRPIIMDAEYYESHYYLFDVMYYGESYMNKPYSERIAHLPSLGSILPFKTKPIKLITSPNDFRDFVLGNFEFKTDGCVLTPSNGIYKDMQVYKYKPPSHLTIDFLIRECPTSLLGMSPYRVVKGMKTYILFCGITRAKAAHYRLNVLRHYHSIFPGAPRDYFPIQFAPPNAPYAHIYWSQDELDGKIGEFAYRDGNWVLVRVRTDRDIEVRTNRYFGNFYDIAVSIWNSIGNPLLVEDIIATLRAGTNARDTNTRDASERDATSERDASERDASERDATSEHDVNTTVRMGDVDVTPGEIIDNADTTDTAGVTGANPPIDLSGDDELGELIAEMRSGGQEYFKIHDNQQQAASRSFNNAVKFKLYEVFRRATSVLDLGCGKGQDIFKYEKLGVQRLICVDQSQEALDILMERRKKIRRPMHISIARVDLTQPADTIIRVLNDTHIISAQVPRINCSLALHYFMADAAHCGEIAKVISHYLEPNGIFLATFFDGRAVHSLLAKHHGDWRVDRGGAQLYGITAKYRGAFAKFGQAIDVFLPFSEEPLHETLVNIDAVSSVFRAHGLMLIEYNSYSKFLTAQSNLEEVDREYVSLYHYALFKRKSMRVDSVATRPESSIANDNLVVEFDDASASGAVDAISAVNAIDVASTPDV
jgi:SAM-dependent methyltransferase